MPDSPDIMDQIPNTAVPIDHDDQSLAYESYNQPMHDVHFEERVPFATPPQHETESPLLYKIAILLAANKVIEFRPHSDISQMQLMLNADFSNISSIPFVGFMDIDWDDLPAIYNIFEKFSMLGVNIWGFLKINIPIDRLTQEILPLAKIIATQE